MTDNLVFLLNKLSYQIVAQELENEQNPKKKDERYFNKCVRKVRQKGCDVLLNKTDEQTLEDPCITDYGGNWSPLTLITDYGRELQAKGAGKCNEILLTSIKSLEEKQYDYTNELLKFLLLLKKPLFDSSNNFQRNFSSSGLDFLHNSIDAICLLNEEYPSDGLSRSFSFRKALQYEESWTKHFDSKFQVLGEFSKKNLLTPEKVSLDSIFTSRSINKSQSRSNSFVFTDFLNQKSSNSEKNLFDPCSNTTVTDSLLDSFIDNPITHKLPGVLFGIKSSTKSGFLNKPSELIKKRLQLLPEEEQGNGLSVKCSSSIERMIDSKPSVIELKRNSNCSHSFSILYDKSMNSRSRDSSLGSNDSFISRDRASRNSNLTTSFMQSKEIILGLWEEEQALIKQFRPELAPYIPNLRMVTTSEYVEDVKYLLTGINSGTFQFDSNTNSFSMVYGTCLEDVTPESLSDFSKEFLDIGNCYSRLSSCATGIGQSNFDTCTTILQAFWKSIFDFLELHYSAVLEIPATTNLMALKSSTRDLHEMITIIADVCKVTKENEILPQGGELLTYLLQVAESLNRACVTNIIFGILHNCCNVYFMCILQTWMFKGHFEKENNEFFVDCRRQKLKTKSRPYYNSFYIANDKIPSFLRGYEESIFNCGKSVHFLKLFNTEDKFCQILEKTEYPNMYLCLSDEQLDKLEKEFKDYGNRVIDSCGESVTIKELRDEEKEKEKCYLEYVKECKRIQEQQRELLRLKQLEVLKAKKDLKNKLLNEQRHFIESEKERKKLEEEMERRRIEENFKKFAEKKEKMLSEEKSFIKNHYDELLMALERQLNIAELRKENLRKILSKEALSESSRNELLINASNNEMKIELEKIKTADSKTDVSKTKLDHEGNITETAEAEVDQKEYVTRAAEAKLDHEGNITEEAEQEIDHDGNITENLDINSNSESLVKVVESVTNQESLCTMDKFKRSSKGSIIYDENSNPSSKLNGRKMSSEIIVNKKTPGKKTVEKDEKIQKSVSQKSVASEEAARNKCKVLKSEFGMVREAEKKPKPEKKQNSLTDMEKIRRKVLQSEYDILKNSDLISVKTVTSSLDLAKENLKIDPLDQAESLCEIMSFTKVELERKSECTDINNPPEKKTSTPKTPKTESSTSFLTPSDENLSKVETVPTLPDMSDSSSSQHKSQYHIALVKDAQIFHHKFSRQDIFCSLSSAEVDTFSCTDFMKFQRYLQKSALIPLKIQEKLANDALLKHLLKGENLLSHLKSLRGYFFLNDGEFGRSFTHNTFRSLARCTEPQQFFERSNLSNIVHEALNYTIHNCEPNSQNLSFQIVQMPPFLNHSSHDVLSPFELSYRVEWPLNIILTEKALSKYKMVFRFLLKLKRINWTLNENFSFLNSYFKSKRLNGKVLVGSPHYHKIQIYRHAMTQVMITLDDYIFSTGVQFPWIYFLKDLETTENIDHLYQKHVRYIKDVLTRCFLSKNSEDLLDFIHNLIELALKFHYTAKSSVLEIVDGKYEHPKFQVLKTTFNEFCSVIKNFLRTLKEKISSDQVLKSHYVLIEKFDLKLT